MEARPIFSFEPLKTHAIKFPGHPHSLLISQTDLLSRGVSVTWALNSRVSPWPQARRGSVSDLPTHQEIIGRIIVGQDLPLRPFLMNPGCQEAARLRGKTIVGDQLADPVLEERLRHQCHRGHCEGLSDGRE